MKMYLFEEFYLMEYVAKSQPTFHKNISCPFSGPENKPGKKSLYYLLHASYLLHLVFDPEDDGEMFLWNVRWLSMGYTAIYVVWQ
jgi:hypothetical protein